MPPNPHCQWRDAKEFQRCGIYLSTSSDEVYKLLDAAITQIVGRYEDPNLGGSDACLSKMIQADPDNVIARAIKIYQSGLRVYNDDTCASDVKMLTSLSLRPQTTEWERRHARAIIALAKGQVRRACDEWEAVLGTWPRDILALHELHETCLGAGDTRRLFDSCAQVVKHWEHDYPHYGEMLAMYAFGLQETNQFDEAEKTTLKALDANPNNPWAYHTMAHVNEMQGRYGDGIKFMANHEHIWSNSTQRCHNYWHVASQHYKMGQLAEAHTILQENILPAMVDRKTMSNMTDVASMCFKLDYEGYDVISCLQTVSSLAKDHVDDHAWTFTDVNAMMAFVSTGHREHASRLNTGIVNFIKHGEGDVTRVYSEVGLPLLNAIQAFRDEDFERAAHLLSDVKDHVYKIGGSNAQREIFTWMQRQALARCTSEQ